MSTCQLSLLCILGSLTCLRIAFLAWPRRKTTLHLRNAKRFASLPGEVHRFENKDGRVRETKIQLEKK